MDENKKNLTAPIAIVGGIIAIAILVFGTILTGRSAQRDTTEAVRSVSMLYLNELAGRREQVVEDNLNDNINVINVAIGLMTDEDKQDLEHLQKYQEKMKALFNLERFAFVDSSGLVYTALGVEEDIDQYDFDYQTISGPKISVRNLDSLDKTVVIAVPVADLQVGGKEMVACFMEMGIDAMLKGISMSTQSSEATFFNIYTNTGIALSNTVLGGLAAEDNLLEALQHAEYAEGYSYEQVAEDFAAVRGGIVSFTYNGIQETLSYVPVNGTDWLLTYLVRDSVISDRISAVSESTIRRSLILSLVTALILAAIFAFLIVEVRKNSKMQLEKRATETENRIKQEEME